MDLDADLLRELGAGLRREALKTHTPDSCIYTTALTINAMRRDGHDAYALPVEAYVFNSAYVEYARSHERVVPAEVLAAGGWSIGVGLPETPPRANQWLGHLVAIVDRRWLCDFSLDQASRPEHGIVLGPIVATASEAFLRAREGLGLDFDGGRVEYHARPRDRSYRESVDWRRGLDADVHVTIRR